MILPTMLAGNNLTIVTDEINGTEYITVESFGSETTIVTPAAFACNVSHFKHDVLFAGACKQTSEFWLLFVFC